MQRIELEKYISTTYSAVADYPWTRYPDYEVFRHCSNRKWFALLMDVPASKLGLPGTDLLTVVNLKCDPALLGELLSEPGFFPAYHMNKDSWITAALDFVADEKIKFLLDISFSLTDTKRKKHPL